MAYLVDSREDSKSRSPLRRPSCLQSAAQDKERRQSQRRSGFQVAGAPEGVLPKYVSAEWNLEVWLSELHERGCDRASLNKLVHSNQLYPKLATWILLSFYMRIADGVYSLAPPVRNYSALLQTTCLKATMSL